MLGCDPGFASGFAVYDLNSLTPIYLAQSENGIKGFAPMFRTLNKMFAPEHVACENFTLRPTNKFTAELSPRDCIGWLKGEGLCSSFPEPSTHMTLTRLREKKDNYADSKITKMMKEAGFKVGKGHTRMGLSVAVWHAAKVLNHRPTLALLKPKD